jgi:TfoX/Sxy family transcriptional regulator of competence genes
MMFGHPVYTAGGNMFAGLYGDEVFLRLSEQDRQEIQTRYAGATLFEPMSGRPMREYVVVPRSLFADFDAFMDWAERAHEYATSLPAKAPKAKRPRKAT